MLHKIVDIIDKQANKTELNPDISTSFGEILN